MSRPSKKLVLPDHQQLAVSERPAAELCELSADTLRRKRRDGTGPRYCRIGGPNGLIRYRIADLDDWLKSQSVASRSEEVSRG